MVATGGCLKRTNIRDVFHGRGRSSTYCSAMMLTDGQDKGRKLSCITTTHYVTNRVVITAARGGLSGGDKGVAG